MSYGDITPDTSRERTCPNCESVNGEVRTALDGTEGCPICMKRCERCDKFKDILDLMDGVCLDCQVNTPDLFETMAELTRPQTAHGDILDDKICVN